MAGQMKARLVTVDIVEFKGRPAGTKKDNVVMWRVEINNNYKSKVVYSPCASRILVDDSALYWSDLLGAEVREVDERHIYGCNFIHSIKAVG